MKLTLSFSLVFLTLTCIGQARYFSVFTNTSYFTKIDVGLGLLYSFETKIQQRPKIDPGGPREIPAIFLHNMYIGTDYVLNSKNLYCLNVGYWIKKTQSHTKSKFIAGIAGVRGQFYTDLNHFIPSISPEIGVSFCKRQNHMSEFRLSFKVSGYCSFTQKNDFSGINPIVVGIRLNLFYYLKSYTLKKDK